MDRDISNSKLHTHTIPAFDQLQNHSMETDSQVSQRLFSSFVTSETQGQSSSFLSPHSLASHSASCGSDSPEDRPVMRRAVKRAHFASDDSDSDSDTLLVNPSKSKKTHASAHVHGAIRNLDTDTELSDDDSSEDEIENPALESLENKVKQLFVEDGRFCPLDEEEKQAAQSLLDNMEKTIEIYRTGSLSLLPHKFHSSIYMEIKNQSWQLQVKDETDRWALFGQLKEILTLWASDQKDLLMDKVQKLQQKTNILIIPNDLAFSQISDDMRSFVKNNQTLEFLFNGNVQALKSTLHLPASRFLLAQLAEVLEEDLEEELNDEPAQEKGVDSHKSLTLEYRCEFFTPISHITFTTKDRSSYIQLLKQLPGILRHILSGNDIESAFKALETVLPDIKQARVMDLLNDLNLDL